LEALEQEAMELEASVAVELEGLEQVEED